MLNLKAFSFLMIVLFLGDGGISAWAQSSDKTVTPVEEDLAKMDLRIAVEKQRGQVRDQEARTLEAKRIYRMARKNYREKRKVLENLKHGESERLSLYYQTTLKEPITKDGLFREKADEECATSRDLFHRAKKTWQNEKKVLKNEKRLFLEEVQRFKDYDQAKAEGWVEQLIGE